MAFGLAANSCYSYQSSALGGIAIRHVNAAVRTVRLLTRVLCASLLVAIASAPAGAQALEGAAPNSWQLYFSPGGGCTQAIVEAIDGAHRQIHVQAYEMTSARIKYALLAAHRRGVEVEAIFDPEAFKETDSMADQLAAGGIPVFVDSFHSPGIAHNKVMVIDQAVVITGSFNFTKAAETRNAENLLVIHDTTMASAFERNFATHLAHSSPLGAADIPAPKPAYHRRYRRNYHWNNYW
jgi:phosphatidylserine/phosphatidylglycerophosphate/cardiolipin synthase-like enzyme